MKHIILAAFASASFTYAAEPVAPTASPPSEAPTQSAGDLASNTLTDSLRAKPADGAKVLEAGFNMAFNFPDHVASQRTLSSMLRFKNSLPKAERAAYMEAIKDRLADELAKPDMPDRMRNNMLATQVTMVIDSQKAADQPDLAEIRASIDSLATKFPQSGYLPSFELSYAKLVAKSDPAAAVVLYKKIMTMDSKGAADAAANELRVAELLSKPLDLKFTSADGREVDLAKLRGKVVLIDFWATWCGPCVAELPNVIRVYDEYHDKGFEVIGISFELSGYMSETLLRNPGNAGKKVDPPEVVAEKKAIAKAKMLAFTTAKKMPWPQHYDGEFWNNEIGQRFNIGSIPAMFVLDQEGNVVSTNARGEALEPLVKKLLGLAP